MLASSFERVNMLHKFSGVDLRTTWKILFFDAAGVMKVCEIFRSIAGSWTRSSSSFRKSVWSFTYLGDAFGGISRSRRYVVKSLREVV